MIVKDNKGNILTERIDYVIKDGILTDITGKVVTVQYHKEDMSNRKQRRDTQFKRV